MRTLVLSDLHLGCRARPRSVESARSLTALLRHLGATPLRIILNGDTFDFAAEADTLRVDVSAVMRGFVEGSERAGVLAWLGRNVDAGGELIVRPGEDDSELSDPALQDRVVAGLGVSLAGRRRVSFTGAGAPTVVEVGGARVLILRASPGHGGARRRRIAELLNQLRIHYGVGLAEHLRPDYEAAVLAAIAVNPTAVKLVLRRRDPSARWRSEAETLAWIFALVQKVVLDDEERDALLTALDPELTLAGADYPHLDTSRLKIFAHCLGRRSQIDAQGLRVLRDAEVGELRARALRLRASAVLFAYSHVPAWRAGEGEGRCLVDTGSWGPTIDGARAAPVRRILEAWERIPRLDGLSDPGLLARAGLRDQRTAAIVEPLARGHGARVCLFEWSSRDVLVRLRETDVQPS